MASELSEQTQISQNDNGQPPVVTRFQNEHFQEGGTVENVLRGTFLPPERFQWYVLAVGYGREQEVALQLRQWGFVAYVPTHKMAVKQGNHEKETVVSWLPNTLFLLVHDKDAEQFKKVDLKLRGEKENHLAHISFRYDHTRQTRWGKNPPMTIPHADMLNFMRLVEVHDPQTAILTDSCSVNRIGEMVEVAAGRFKGIRGRVARFRKSNVVLVDLSGLCLATTAYVPKAFLRPVDDRREEEDEYRE